MCGLRHDHMRDLTRSAQVTDPTTDSFGAGVGSNFTGHEDAARNFRKTAGVVEGRPGIVESTNIDPLNENSNKGVCASCEVPHRVC